MVRFSSYSFTASDSSDESTAGRVVSPCSIMFSDVYRRGMLESKNIDYAKQHRTPHCWLPAKVMYPTNSTKRFSWLICSTSILLMKNVQIYICSLWKQVDFPVNLLPTDVLINGPQISKSHLDSDCQLKGLITMYLPVLIVFC